MKASDIIAALITGACAIIAAIIARESIKKKKEEKQIIEIHVKPEDYIEIPTSSSPKHPVFLNPDDYDIDEENYFVTLGGLLQQSRNPKDVSVKKLNRTDDGENKK